MARSRWRWPCRLPSACARWRCPRSAPPARFAALAARPEPTRRRRSRARSILWRAILKYFSAFAVHESSAPTMAPFCKHVHFLAVRSRRLPRSSATAQQRRVRVVLHSHRRSLDLPVHDDGCARSACANAIIEIDKLGTRVRPPACVVYAGGLFTVSSRLIMRTIHRAAAVARARAPTLPVAL